MSQYRDESHAVVRAVNAGEGRPKPALWQLQYTSGYRVSAANDSDHLEGLDRLLADSMAHAVIKRALSPAQYHVLVLKYSGNEGDRIKALKELIGVVGTNAGPTCKALSVGSWAGYKSMASGNYDQQDASDRTLRDWRNQIRKELDGLHKGALDHLQRVFKDGGLIGGES